METAKHITYGARIRAARGEAKLTQSELAALSGVPQSNLSKIESEKQGCNANTYDRLMVAITKHLGHPPVTVGAVDGLYGITARAQGRLSRVDPMAPPKPVEWLARGFLARRFVTMIAGQEGAGKSSVTQMLAVGLAEGRKEALGMELPGVPLRGLVIDAENVMVVEGEAPDGSLAQDRFQRYGLSKENADRIEIFGAAGFDLDKDFDTLDAALSDIGDNEDTRVHFVILDSFTSLWFGNENSVDDVRRVLNKLNRLAVKHNVGVLLIHHTNKQGDAYRGSSAIGATIAAVFTFARVMMKNPDTGKKDQHPTLRFLNCYKMRVAAEAKGRLLQIQGDGVFAAGTSDVPEEWSEDDGTE